MLETPSKPAKRLSSLFSLVSSKDPKESSSSKNQAQTHTSNRSQSSQWTQSSKPAQHAATSSQPSIRYAASVQNFQNQNQTATVAPRIVSAPLPSGEAMPKNQLLMPPPPLNAVNTDLAVESPSNNENHKRRQSWGGNIPGLGLGLGLGRPQSRSGPRPASQNTESRLSKGRSWMPNKSSKNSEAASNHKQMMRAWIAGTTQDVPYDVDRLVAGEKITEIWDDTGDTYVYLFPQTTGRSPSFKVHSSIFSASQALTLMARGSDPAAVAMRPVERLSQMHLAVPASPPMSPRQGSIDGSQDDSDGRRSRDILLDESTQELHLYLPVPLNSDVSNNRPVLHDDDIDMLVLFRNVFAFLIGQSLIATPRCSTLFSIFMEISGILERFHFSNFDGSTFGEAAVSSFACYCNELGLSDVRKSREKTLDALVLGEKMRYLPLYQEGFIHGVGKLDLIKVADVHKYALISGITQKRLERGYLDLENRLKIAREKLEDFYFPQLFSGFANSTVMNEAKIVRFKNWKNAYIAFRKQVMSYYRSKYGSWPPKANSKKHSFEEGGLNRLVLKELYQDFADLYDMLVDRTALTTRSADMTLTEPDKAEGADIQESTSRALRYIMSEFDRSTPPVAPPIPFDIPLQPTIRSIKKRLDPKDEPKERAKKLSSGEVNEILLGSYNQKSLKPTPFLEFFTHFERRAGSGKSADELADNRYGQWLFMYAVLQSLPMVVVDAPNVRHSEGVEYFLCIPPRGGSPWCKEDPTSGRSWFGVAGGASVVHLPSDVVANGVEGIYRRSHCWQVAAKWVDQQLPPMARVEPEPQSPVASSSPKQSHQGYQAYQAYQAYQPPNINPPALSSTESNSDKLPTPLLTPGNVTPPPYNLPLPNPGFARPGNRSSIHIGLEALPLPAGVMPVDPPTRPVSHNPNLSFDHILGGMAKQGGKK